MLTPPQGPQSPATFSWGHLGQTQALLPQLPVPETSTETPGGGTSVAHPLLEASAVLGASPRPDHLRWSLASRGPADSQSCGLCSGWGKG